MKDRGRRPQGHAQGEHRGRPGRPLRGRRRQRPRHLPAQPGRPGQGRASLVELAGGTPGAGPRHRRAHRLHQAASYLAATRCRPRRSPRSARRSSTITRNEGKPEAACDKIVEGRLNGWFQERRAARAEVRPRREADDHPAARRCQRRPLRPDRHRRLMADVEPTARWSRVLLKLSGEAFAGEPGLRHRRRRRRADRLGDRRRPRASSASTSPSSSAAATSGGA